MATPSPASPAVPTQLRHGLVVRLTHWVHALCFFALLISGVELIISHPRFYWGEVGYASGPSLFEIPIPASRDDVKTGYNYVLPDQNGWSRSLHFQSAWLAVFAGLLYVGHSLRSGHLRKHLLPVQLSWSTLADAVKRHLRFEPEKDLWRYNLLQQLSYVLVVFGLFPALIWTGLAMSPAVGAAFPFLVTALGGHQSARTLHFVLSIALLIFFLVHVLMVYLSGFRQRVASMITGHAEAQEENQ